MPGEGCVRKFSRRYPPSEQWPDGRTIERWQARVSLGGRNDRRFLTKTVRTEREAKAAIRELLRDRDAQRNPTKLRVGDYLARWVRDVRNIRPTTRHGYEAAITFHLRPALGHLALASLTPYHVDQALVAMAPTMSPKLLRNVHAVLRRALAQAVRQGLLARNPAGREFVDTPRVPVTEPRALSGDELRRLLETARGDRLEALFVLAAGTGLRQGELLGLAWQDIDLAHGLVHVRQELARRNHRYVLDDPKTERSKRTVPLAPHVVVALRAHEQRVRDAGFVPVSTGPVFTSLDGHELSGSWLTHHFYRLCERAGIAKVKGTDEKERPLYERIPFKILRATFASLLYDAGVGELVVSGLLGHARTTTSKRHYIATTPEQAVAAIERLVG